MGEVELCGVFAETFLSKYVGTDFKLGTGTTLEFDLFSSN